MTLVKLPAALIASLLWIGFVCAISFMEAWLKFRALGITVPLGLGIGRLVFNALNKVEWVFAFTILINIISAKKGLLRWSNFTYFIVISILLLQTIWLLPALDARAEMHVQGLSVPHSNLHIYFVAFEVVKVVCLAIFTSSLFQNLPPSS